MKVRKERREATVKHKKRRNRSLTESVTTVRLAARTRSEAALVRLTGLDPLRRFLDQRVIQYVADAGHRDRTVGPAHILLAVEMHAKRAVLALHQLQEIVQLLPIDCFQSVS